MIRTNRFAVAGNDTTRRAFSALADMPADESRLLLTLALGVPLPRRYSSIPAGYPAGMGREMADALRDRIRYAALSLNKRLQATGPYHCTEATGIIALVDAEERWSDVQAICETALLLREYRLALPGLVEVLP